MLTTAWGPVGTRGGCGAGWRPCACPGGNALHWGLCGANRSHPNQDKHKAPSSTPPRPLSLQDPGTQASQWIGFPDSVVNIHQGWTLLVMRHCHVQIEPCLRDDGPSKGYKEQGIMNRSARLDRYKRFVGEDLLSQIYQLAEPLAGLHILHVNTTAQGGGVAELLHALIPVMEELGIRHTWKVVPLDDASNRFTVHIVDLLQGIEHGKI